MGSTTMFEQHKNAILKAATAARPRELCGVIWDGKFIELENVAAKAGDGFDQFEMSDADILKYVVEGKSKLEAIVHSHPNGPLWPTEMDQRQQAAMAVPWVIAAWDVTRGSWEYFDWGDHILDLPILERDFRYAVEDCQTVPRKWFWQTHGHKFPLHPTTAYWWYGYQADGTPNNTYVETMIEYGFVRIYPETPRDLVPGDVYLQKQGEPRPLAYNHAGLYVGRGLVYTHHPKKLSEEKPVGPIFRRTDMWWRLPPEKIVDARK